jgi:membrane protease YdiL (CAAX protease family)
MSTPTATTGSARPGLRSMLLFATIAVVGGGTLFGKSTVVDPGEPFLLAGVYLGLALPALVLTRLTGGPGALRTLLRRCVRVPRAWWWLPVAGLTLPLASFALASALGGARPLTASSAGFYLADLVIGVVLVNLAEELGWTGFFQSRAMLRWGAVGGSLVTAVFFTLIHLPLAAAGVEELGEAVRNVLVVGAVAVGLRLLVGRLHTWTGGSILAVGVLHSSFNATETLLDPAYDWVRIVTVVALAVVAVAVTGRPPAGGGMPGRTTRTGVTERPDLRVHAERNLRVAVR